MLKWRHLRLTRMVFQGTLLVGCLQLGFRAARVDLHKMLVGGDFEKLCHKVGVPPELHKISYL